MFHGSSSSEHGCSRDPRMFQDVGYPGTYEDPWTSDVLEHTVCVRILIVCGLL